MKGTVFGFSKKEIVWFTLIFVSSLIIALFCLLRVFNKLYKQSDENEARIRDLSSEVLHLQEASMHAVTIQRSSLNLIIYSGNQAELTNVAQLISRNRDTLIDNLKGFTQRGHLPTSMVQDIAAAGYAYLQSNQVYRQMLLDSVRNDKAADFNVQSMRPALRKFTDLVRKNSMSITGDIQKTSSNKVNLFSLYEFWIFLVVCIPYLYFFYRFARLFIKVLVMDTQI